MKYNIHIVHVRDETGRRLPRKIHAHIVMDFPDEKTARRELEADRRIRVHRISRKSWHGFRDHFTEGDVDT